MVLLLTFDQETVMSQDRLTSIFKTPVAVALSIGVIALGLVCSPSAAAAPNRNVTIVIGTLTCLDTEDWGDDETLLRVWTPMPQGRVRLKEFRKSMNASGKRTFRINQAFTYNPANAAWGDGMSAVSPPDGALGLELLDEDNPPLDLDDALGVQFISASQVGRGQVAFQANGANYQLTYEVR
jgi:hypothetical protein